MDSPLLNATLQRIARWVQRRTDRFERKKTMYRDILAFGTTTARRRLPPALQFYSGIRPQPLACRNVLLVEHRDVIRSEARIDVFMGVQT